MANYNGCKDLESLAAAYGYDMKLHGKSMYWTSPRECPDTTSDLEASATFQALSSDDKRAILSYGHLMKRFGMGCYQERGANAELYNKYAGSDPPNPFNGRREPIKLPEKKEPDGPQPGAE